MSSACHGCKLFSACQNVIELILLEVPNGSLKHVLLCHDDAGSLDCLEILIRLCLPIPGTH